MFRRLLGYKGELYGCRIVAVPPQYTSQRCSSCSYTNAVNRKTQSEFLCLRCGHAQNADLNAAINILAAARPSEALNACGEDVRPSVLRDSRQTSVKQESSTVPLAAADQTGGLRL